MASLPYGYRNGAAAFTLNVKIYAGMGGMFSGEYIDFNEFNPETKTWRRIEDFTGKKECFLYPSLQMIKPMWKLIIITTTWQIISLNLTQTKNKQFQL